MLNRRSGIGMAVALALIIIAGQWVFSSTVHLLAPTNRATLPVGKPSVVRALITANYEVAMIEVSLLDSNTGFRQTWQFANPSSSRIFYFEGVINLPETAPLSGDYRLLVNALSSSRGRGDGYGIPVEIVSAP